VFRLISEEVFSEGFPSLVYLVPAKVLMSFCAAQVGVLRWESPPVAKSAEARMYLTRLLSVASPNLQDAVSIASVVGLPVDYFPESLPLPYSAEMVHHSQGIGLYWPVCSCQTHWVLKSRSKGKRQHLVLIAFHNEDRYVIVLEGQWVAPNRVPFEPIVLTLPIVVPHRAVANQVACCWDQQGVKALLVVP